MRRDKRGISVMVSYVLIIVLAVALSAAVYTYLLVIVPKKEKPQCPEDIFLTVQDYECAGQNLDLTLQNKGLFTVDAAYIRLGEQGRRIRALINSPDEPGPNRDKFFIDLPPGQPYTNTYQTTIITGPGNYTLEVQPAVTTEKGLAVCESIVTQTIECT